MFDTLEDHPMAIFHAAEQATVTEIRWLAWIDEAEALFGHSLDGDQEDDGFSLDSAYDAYREGLTPVDYWQSVER